MSTSTWAPSSSGTASSPLAVSEDAPTSRQCSFLNLRSAHWSASHWTWPRLDPPLLYLLVPCPDQGHHLLPGPLKPDYGVSSLPPLPSPKSANPKMGMVVSGFSISQEPLRSPPLTSFWPRRAGRTFVVGLWVLCFIRTVQGLQVGRRDPASLCLHLTEPPACAGGGEVGGVRQEV